ncbi:MAG: hypothetical protein V8S57_07210, partial [Oscillospiraceae bacterium]
DERAVVVRRVGGVAVRDAADSRLSMRMLRSRSRASDGLHAHGVRVLNVEREIGALAREPGLQPHEHHLDQQHDGRGEDGTLDVARAADKTDDGRGPESGGGGQTLDALVARDDDRARADKADAGDDLRAETRDVVIQVLEE